MFVNQDHLMKLDIIKYIGVIKMKNLDDLMVEFVECGKKSLTKTVIDPARKNRAIRQYKALGMDVFEDNSGKLWLDEKGIVDYLKK